MATVQSPIYVIKVISEDQIQVSVGGDSISVSVLEPASLGPTGPGLPSGGTVGQLVRKASLTDFDTEWFTPDTDDIAEGATNLYFTEGRANAASDVVANTAVRHTHTNKAVLDATTASFLLADESKLDGIEAGAQVNTVDSVNGATGTVVLDTDDVSEGSTNLYFTEARANAASDVAANTSARHSHTNKAQLDLITDAGSGVIISGTERTKLSGIEAGAQVNTVASVNGATGAVVLGYSDVGAAPTSHTHVEADITDLGTYLTDAPSDGSTYGRKNGAWEAVTGGGGASRIDELTDSLSAGTTVDFSNTKPTFGDITIQQDNGTTSAKLHLGDGTNTGELAAILVGSEQISYRDDIIGDFVTGWILSDNLIVQGDMNLNQYLRLNSAGLYGDAAIIMGTPTGPGNPPWIKFDDSLKEFEFNYPANFGTLGALGSEITVSDTITFENDVQGEDFFVNYAGNQSSATIYFGNRSGSFPDSYLQYTDADDFFTLTKGLDVATFLQAPSLTVTDEIDTNPTITFRELGSPNVDHDFYYDTVESRFATAEGLWVNDYITTETGIKTDDILENNTDAGVTIDGLLIKDGAISAYSSHVASTSNPHSVTKAQVGLDQLVNVTQVRTDVNGLSANLAAAGSPSTLNLLLTETAAGAIRYMTCANIPVSTPVQTALNLKADSSTLSSHTGATAAHGATGAVVGTTNTQTLTNKTLTTPTVGDFTNATHTHANAAGGGQISHDDLSDVSANEHIDWTNATADLLTTGDVEADTFTYTNGVERSILFSAQDIRSSYNWTGYWIWQAGYATNAFAYAQMDIASTPTIQAVLVFNMPADYVTGTDVTFDLGFGTTSAASPYIYNVDIDFIVKAISYNISGGGDEYNAIGREYTTTGTDSFTEVDVACASQTFVRKNGIALTSSGSIGSHALLPGDQVLIMFRFKPGTTDPTPATSAHASMVEVHYTAANTTSC